jgi:hypothetical protein
MAADEEVTSLDENLESTLRETLKGINEREAPVDEAAPAVEATAPKVERARDETGKFVPKESAAPAEKPDIAQTAGAVVQAAADAPEAPAVPQGIDINRAPSSWKPAAKAAWAALPEPVRAEIYRREGDFHTGLKDIKTNADFGQSVKGIVEPYRMLIEAEGSTPELAISETLKTAALLRVGTPQQKQQALLALDQQFNIGLVPLIQRAMVAQAGGAPQQQFQQPQTFMDPRVDQLMAAVNRQEQERAQAENARSSSAVELFVKAKDDKGNPKYPFVDNVIDDMSARVQIIRGSNPGMSHEEVLKQAYEAAAWANPETRAVLMGQQQAQAQQSADNLRKVGQAKRANAGNMPKRGALPTTAPMAKWGSSDADEEIRATYRQLTS